MKDEKTNHPEQNIPEDIFVLKPYTHKELARLYNVCWVTFQKWMKEEEDKVGKKQGHFYKINQVLQILKIFGIPKRFKISVQEVEDLFKGK